MVAVAVSSSGSGGGSERGKTRGDRIVGTNTGGCDFRCGGLGLYYFDFIMDER